MVYRCGDVVRFARGSNEYVGTVVKVSKVLTALTVIPEGSVAHWRIGERHVLRLESPVLTPKECAALLALRALGKPVTVRTMRERGNDVSATTLRGLAARGFAVGEREGVTARGVMEWRLSEEGRRVAGSL